MPQSLNQKIATNQANALETISDILKLLLESKRDVIMNPRLDRQTKEAILRDITFHGSQRYKRGIAGITRAAKGMNVPKTQLKVMYGVTEKVFKVSADLDLCGLSWTVMKRELDEYEEKRKRIEENVRQAKAAREQISQEVQQRSKLKSKTRRRNAKKHEPTQSTGEE